MLPGLANIFRLWLQPSTAAHINNSYKEFRRKINHLSKILLPLASKALSPMSLHHPSNFHLQELVNACAASELTVAGAVYMVLGARGLIRDLKMSLLSDTVTTAPPRNAIGIARCLIQGLKTSLLSNTVSITP
jgi:hypothetical protein